MAVTTVEYCSSCLAGILNSN